MRNNINQNNKSSSVAEIILYKIKSRLLLSFAIVSAVVMAIVTSLFPPLILGGIIDAMTAGQAVNWRMILAYFGLIVLTGLMEAAREALLTVFGQKITHALRSGLMDKFTRLTADCLNKQEPGAVVSRFVGDVDTVEALFTSGIISMFADVCRIISILAVIWFRNKGIAIVIVVLLPFLFWFTRHVQKNMLSAQIANRRAVSRASGHVPETLHNIRTVHTLGREKYMEQRYDEYISEGYRAMEKTNFYDAIYSPVILILNAVVIAVVMLFSASGSPVVLTLFGMSAGTAVAVMNYISQIFSPVESLGMEIQTIQSALAGVKRIDEFLAQDEFAKQDTKAPDGPVVRFDNVTFGYDDKKHLKFDQEIKTRYWRRDEDSKIERIGKKYQWLALYEILARVMDNFPAFVDRYNDKPERDYVRKLDGFYLPKTQINISPPTRINIFSQYKMHTGSFPFFGCRPYITAMILNNFFNNG